MARHSRNQKPVFAAERTALRDIFLFYTSVFSVTSVADSLCFSLRSNPPPLEKGEKGGFEISSHSHYSLLICGNP